MLGVANVCNKMKMAPRLSLTFWCDYLNGWQSSTTKDPCFSSYILDDSFIFSQQTPAPACESYEIFPTICLLITIYLSWVGGSFKFSTMYSCRMRNSQLYDECKTHSKGFGTAMRMFFFGFFLLNFRVFTWLLNKF